MRKKNKLRTVADVIARLKWDQPNMDCEDEAPVFLGYDDRITGPLEISLMDYIPASKGGDLPEHRIWYVRAGDRVLWDKIGRVDCVFGSGNGKNTSISQECRQNVCQAQLNLQKLEDERQARRFQKQKERARRARRRVRLGETSNGTDSVARVSQRFQWHQFSTFVWSKEGKKWKRFEDSDDVKRTISQNRSQSRNVGGKLSFLSWNILFDAFDTENDHEETRQRWARLVQYMVTLNVDLIALQEVTPSFAEILLGHRLVQRHYMSTCSLDDTTSVAPSGNLLLWKREVFSQVGPTEVCTDADRRRVVLAILQYTTGHRFAIANVHLPADHGERKRDLARRRELAVVLGRLQRLAGEDQCNFIPFILGDFNSSDTGIVRDDLFDDAWYRVHPCEPGYTFDPKTNVLAARTFALTDAANSEGKRLDRIFLGRNAGVDDWRSVTCDLVGHTSTHPLSDHYGIRATFPLGKSQPNLKLAEDIWASHAPTTPDCLLGILLSGATQSKEWYDASSTLPTPHITLLHDFVEFEDGCTDLLAQSLRHAVEVLRENQIDTEYTLSFTPKSVQIFEHGKSATLVLCPDLEEPENAWLSELYGVLRRIFPQCNGQECRFATGWTPHVSFKTLGTVTEARRHARLLIDSFGCQRIVVVPVLALAAFSRCYDNGMMYPSRVVTFRCCGRGSLRSNRHHDFCKKAESALTHLEREVRELGSNLGLDMRVVPYGSYALGSCLPEVSDIDVVIQISQGDRACVKSVEASFLEMLGFSIKSHLQKCEMRHRAAMGGKLQILTLKLWTGSPVLDLMMCYTTLQPDGAIKIDSQNSLAAAEALQDTAHLLAVIGDERLYVYQEALRLLKLWAHRRQVYGIGFFGGGGWALWLAEIIKDVTNEGLRCSRSLLAEFFHMATAQMDGEDFRMAGNQAEALRKGFESVLVKFGRNTTRSSLHAIWVELSTAAPIARLVEGEEALLKLLSPYKPEFFHKFSAILTVRVGRPEGNALDEMKHRGSSQLLCLIVALESKVGDARLVRPFLRPIYEARFLTWLVAVEEVAPDTLNHFAKREEEAFRSALDLDEVTIQSMHPQGSCFESIISFAAS